MYFGGSCNTASSSAKTSLLQTRGASRDIATSMLMEAALNCSAAGGRVLFITHRLAAFPTLPSSVTLSSGGGGWFPWYGPGGGAGGVEVRVKVGPWLG